jgi:succinate dehydrogenase / fumarate reductase flavoprotein subunit
VNWKAISVTLYYYAAVVMAMYFTYLQMPWESNVTAAWKAHKKGAFFGNPCFTQIHPTCIPVSGDHQSKLTLMSESLRNDGRIWVPKKQGDNRKASDIPEEERDYYLERRYPAFGNLVPRDVASSRAAKERCDEGYGVGTSKASCVSRFCRGDRTLWQNRSNKQGLSNAERLPIRQLGKEVVKEKYGNLFEMYEKITAKILTKYQCVSILLFTIQWVAFG